MDPLNAVEVRVLGSLMEKDMTTPDYYPLTLNALTNACNQSSNRDPVMALAERATMGMRRRPPAASAARMARVAATPSISGIWMSISTRS